VFGEKKLGHARTRLVIPAFNVIDGSAALFKTAHCARFKQDYLRSCVDVALATSAAPTFLPAHELDDGRAYLDGGLWANNPMLVGVLEAIVNCGQEASGIDVLNVGTTDEAFHVPLTHRRRGGVLRWVKGLPMLFMQAQSDAVLKQATILLAESRTGSARALGAGGFPPRRWHAVRQQKALAHIDAAAPPARGVSKRFAETPLAHPPDGYLGRGPHDSVLTTPD
jgi:hypothetical protein